MHYTTIVGDGFRVLKDGSTVQYDAVFLQNRWRAVKVVRQDPVVDVQVRPTRGYARSPTTMRPAGGSRLPIDWAITREAETDVLYGVPLAS